jgi:hypothetical protein
VSERQSDPRRRPPDPAGTQPKVDPESLHGPQAPHRELAPQAARGETPALPAGAPAAGEQTVAVQPPSGATELQHTAIDHGTAGDHRGTISAPAATLPDRAEATGKTSGSHPHTPRFQFLYGALGALGAAALVLILVLARSPAPVSPPPWSAWQPSEDGVDPAQQIADHVAPQYRLDDGRQIVAATGGPPVLRGQPLTLGVVRSGQSPAALEGNNVLYQLCGEGTDCSIKEGKPSVERGLLLYREALELALYTFHYISGVDHVVVTIPPPPPAATPTRGAASTSTTSTGGSRASSTSTGDSTTSSTASTKPLLHALLFAQQDIAPELGRPLSATLSQETPRVSQMSRSPDAALVEALAGPRVYDYLISESQQSGPIMLLEPPGLGG